MALTRSPDGFSSSARLDASEAIDLMEPLKFQTEDERHELSVLYEECLAEMGNAGIAGGRHERGADAQNESVITYMNGLSGKKRLATARR